MIDGFDYKEPSCALCGGKEFYYPDKDAPTGRIPVGRIIERLDDFLGKNRTAEARAHLEYWAKEAEALRDKQGELTVVNELIGVYRKAGEQELAFSACDRALEIIGLLSAEASPSAATVYLNIATAYKAFGKAASALPLYEKTLEIYRKHYDETNPIFAGLYNNFALALVDEKEFGRAEELYKKAAAVLESERNLQSEPHAKPDAAITYVNLAHLYYDTGKPKDTITDCMFKAYGLLTDETVAQNGYLAFVYEKCYPSFEFFGYELVAKELKEKSEALYAGA